LKSPEYQIITLAHGVGDFIQYWGFRRIHGQVWTLIYLAKEPLHATEIVNRLGVSKALISLAINELVEYGLISQTSEPERKIKTYTANPKMFTVIRDVLRSRELPLLERVVNDQRNLEEVLSEAADINPQRLAAIGEMANSAREFLASYLCANDKKNESGSLSAISHMIEALDRAPTEATLPSEN
jgi:DNA-binding transcriptional regulator GbsR (MarR family)